ncbi:MAG TPA: hypothetical protein VGS19_24925 [Streptosporangiaceae bacterium]|nr:hypothetical protein [Streptosporangiaceae bacterium]
MATRSQWGMTPRQSIEAECGRRGKAAVVAGCIDLLAGGEADSGLVTALGGPGGRLVLDAGPDSAHWYWLRVWGARGLLWAWDDSAQVAVVAAMSDGHWRVREMAAKVVARHRVGAALTAVAGLQHDRVPRVRAAAARATAVLTATRA